MTPCRRCGCANLVTRKQKGYCDDHANLRWGWSRISANARGYGYAWQKVRKQALERDKYLCVHCMRAGFFISAKEVDHIVPKSKGGGDELENLQSLCVACHANKTRFEKG